MSGKKKEQKPRDENNEPLRGEVIDELPETDADGAQNPAETENPEVSGENAADELSSLRKQADAEREKCLRLAAEYDNYRKRSQKEREAIYADVRADTVSNFLQVYDNLARALSHETADEAYRKGVELTMAQFMDVLEKLGVKEIPAVGEKFNPDTHNAIVHEEDASLGEGIITEEFQKGFRLGDKIIRFSLVKVVN